MCMAYYRVPGYKPMIFKTCKEAMRICAELGLTGCMYYVTCYDK